MAQVITMTSTQPPSQSDSLPTAASPESASHTSPTADHPSLTPEHRKASHAAPHALTARSCVTCRRRKVKCDKQEPCSNCTKARSQCIFPAPGRAPRRPRVGGKQTTEREAELLKRLRRLEGVVEELSGQVEVEATKHSPGSENSSTQRDADSSMPDSSLKMQKLRVVGMDEGSGTKKEWISRAWKIGQGPPKTAFGVQQVEEGLGRLVFDEGKSRYVAHPFWSQITDEVQEIKALLDYQDLGSDSDGPIAPTSIITDTEHQSFIMGYSSSDVDLKSLHPLPSQIPFYWQTFLENVHPLVKILHAPTMSKTMKEVQGNLDSLGKSTEALLFAIYFATITSMSTAEVLNSFGLSKELLLKQYRFGVEQALAKAGLLNTSEIVTLQAFVLFLICVRRYDDTRFVWTMTGLIIRIAQSLGIHRDGSKFGLTPFDTEMRRRLWWQVTLLDNRASEDHGSDPSILEYTYDTELPTSCNDEDLDPNSKELPPRRPGVSEMTFCLIRYEISNLSQKLVYVPPGNSPCKQNAQAMSFEDKEKLVSDQATHLEKTYLQYCEDAGPLYWVAATVARLILAKMTLLLYHPLTQPGKPTALSQDVRDRLFMCSIVILEYSHLLENESNTKKWGWLFATYIQWHAIAYVLGELAIRPNSVIVLRAWHAIDCVFENWRSAVAQSKSGRLWKPLKNLMSKARRKREENAADTNYKDIELGIAPEALRPVATGYSDTMSCSRFMLDKTERGNALSNITDTMSQMPLTNMNDSVFQNDAAMLNSQAIGMGLLTSGLQARLQQQQLQQQGQQQTPWLMDDNAFIDLDMNGMDENVCWEGWDDIVRDFQMQTEGQATGMRGPNLGGMGGGWW